MRVVEMVLRAILVALPILLAEGEEMYGGKE